MLLETRLNRIDGQVEYPEDIRSLGRVARQGWRRGNASLQQKGWAFEDVAAWSTWEKSPRGSGYDLVDIARGYLCEVKSSRSGLGYQEMLRVTRKLLEAREARPGYICALSCMDGRGDERRPAGLGADIEFHCGMAAYLFLYGPDGGMVHEEMHSCMKRNFMAAGLPLSSDEPSD